VAIITTNRPEVLNALHDPSWKELYAAYEAAEGDANVRVIVATGAGERAFSTGWDLREATEITAVAGTDAASKLMEGSSRFYSGLPTTKPVIGAINGFCVAGGLEYALMCDILVAVETAEFGLQEVRWAIIPGGGGTQRLPRKIPTNIALEAILTGDRFDAQTAHRYGLVNHVVPREQLMEKALAIANTIARRGPLAVRACRRAIHEGLDLPLREGLELEDALSEDVIRSEDAKEGPRAFVEKREPHFQGR
jgi:enoyl-CoA hydratase/carnithine racemase